MTFDRKTLYVLVAAFAVGYWFSGSSSPPGPPAPERPVLRWIARAAKSLLWIALVAEQPPTAQADRHLVHAPPVGDDGYQVVDHGKGW
jgi:hypothetical protein